MVRAEVALAGAVVLALALGFGLLLWPSTGSEDYRLALGTVRQSAQCGPPDARDVLHVDLLDGREISAQLDGCGNQPGEVLTVEVPHPLPAGVPAGEVPAGEVPAGEVVVRLAGTGVSAATATAQRLSAVGVTIAGIAGAVLAWRLRLVRGETNRMV